MGNTPSHSAREVWTTRLGLVLAMAGNAVGLGNFLRFPRQAVLNDGGSFMVAYFVSLLLLGLPLMWMEWGIGRHGGRFRKGHIPGMFAALWKHPAAKYLGVIGLVVPMAVFIYYTYIESWTLAFMFFSILGSFGDASSPEAMVGFLQSFQGINRDGAFPIWLPYAFFGVTLAANLFILSKGISGGIERLARIGMPILLGFAVILAIVVWNLPEGPTGATPADGFAFMYAPNLAGLTNAGVWLAAAGQIFFTLSVGMGSLAAYASYLSKKDDIVLSGIATASTNEAVEVVLGGSIAIPAAVVFFGVAGATSIAGSGSFNLGFATMPVIFQSLPLGGLLGFMWFGLLFIAGITSSVAMATPITAFFREEFGVKRETVTWSLGAVVFLLGLMHVAWLGQGFLDEWDFWAGTFGLVLFATMEVVLFMWVFGPTKAWASLHDGADIQLPSLFRIVMTYVTPAFLFFLLGWWAVTDALPILLMETSAGGGEFNPAHRPYVLLSRGFLVLISLVFTGLVAWAWRRNRYNDRAGFAEEGLQ